MGYTEIDGRIDGERRKYTKSHSAAATSVGPHTYIRIPLRCCVHLHIYCKLSAPIEKKNQPVFERRVTANAYNKYLFFTMLYMYMYYFLNIVTEEFTVMEIISLNTRVFFRATCIVAKLQHDHFEIIM